MKILSHLSTKQLLKLATVSKQFQATTYIATLHTFIDVSNTNITDRQFGEFIHKLTCHNKIHTIDVNRCYLFFGKVFANKMQLLDSLVEVNLSYSGISNEYFAVLWNNACFLRKIVAIDCISLTDKLTHEVTREHGCIQCIQISDFLSFEAALKIIALLPKLTLLNMDGFFLTQQEVCKILKTVKTLEMLYIPYAIINDGDLEAIIPSIGKLQFLNIRYSDVTQKGTDTLKLLFKHLRVER